MAKYNFLQMFFKKKEQIPDISKANTTIESTNLLTELNKLHIGSWRSKFVSDIYEERTMFPHEEMQIANKGYLYNAFIQSAVNALALFLVGGEIKITSKDKNTETWLNDEIRKTGLLNIWHEHLFRDLIVAGNHYSERIYKGKEIIAYQYISDPHRMYHQLDDKQFIESFVYELPDQQLRGVQFVTIQYYGDRRRTIKGIPLEKRKVFFMRSGQGTIPTYGRGPVAAVINDVEVLLEIERAMAVIARYKAIPKKLMQLVKSNSPKDASYVGNLFNNLMDDENPIIPFEMKVDDLSYSGKDISFEPIVNYLKKKLTIALAPSFLVHGDETNYAVAKEQRISLLLKVKSERESAEVQIKKELKEMAKSRGKVLGDFAVEFGTLDIGQDEETRTAVMNLFNAGVITLNEARENLNYPKDQENGDFYSFELKGGKETGFDENEQEAIKQEFEKYEKTREDKEEENLDKQLEISLKKSQLELIEKKKKMIQQLENE